MEFQKSTREIFFLQRRAQHLFTCRCFFRCKPQENTVPATEAASATVEDVGSGLVEDFVARCWITWFLFVEVCFVKNTCERVDWLPLATPYSQDEICQEDISMTRQSGISAKQR